MTLLDYISNATELPTKTEARTSNLVLVTRPPDFSNLTLKSDWYCDEYDVSGTLSINGRDVEISSPDHDMDKGLFVEVLRSLICYLEYAIIAPGLLRGESERGWVLQEDDFSQEAWGGPEVQYMTRFTINPINPEDVPVVRQVKAVPIRID